MELFMWPKILTNIFSFEVLLAFIVIIIADLLQRRNYGQAVWLVIATAIMALAVVTLKDFFAVERPADALILLDDYAFPSGHATSVMFLSVVLFWYGRALYQVRAWWLVLFVGLLCIAVGYSRLYLQVHKVEQVIAGFALGGAVGGMFYFVVKRL